MGKKSAPKAPDPRQTAAASTSTNVGTAIANAFLNNPDYVGPDGSQTTTQSGFYTWKDPYTGQTYQIPKSTVTSTLSPAQQAIKTQTDATELNLGELANQQSGFLKDYMSKPVDLTNEATEARLMDLATRRLNPELDRRRASMESDLINRGIRPGSDAYSSAQRDQYEGENDALNQLLLTGRQQSVAEALAARNQPINEITALLGASQVASPQMPGWQGSPIPTTDTAGIINTGYQQQLDAWKQKQSGLGSLFGVGAALLGNPSLFAAGAIPSDRRLKTDIKEIGKTKDGQKIYSYRYKAGGPVQIGLMAQEVEKKHPEAVSMVEGFRAVDYGKALEFCLMVGFIFGGNTGETAQSLAAKRKYAEALMAPGDQPQNVTEGWAAIAKALAGQYALHGVRKEEDAQRTEKNSVVGRALASLGPFPAAPPDTGSGNSVAAALNGKAATPANPNVPSRFDFANAESGSQAGEIEAYIRQSAKARGIDPDVAVRVAMSEGGVADPVRQSDVVKDGVREPSFGPFQLYMGGGLGNEFQKSTGLHPSDPTAWQKGVDFALDTAAKDGWGQWYGAKNAGIGERDGIGAPAALDKLATGGVNVAQAGNDLSQFSPAAGGTGGTVQPGKLDLGTLFEAARRPDLTQEERGLINMLLEQEMQSRDPLRQLQIQKMNKELAIEPKQWQKLDDETLFDPASGEVKKVGDGGAGTGGFRFKGTSVEAQSLNGLMDSGQLTPEQAQQLGAGKTVTDPASGAILFMTPQGVFGQAAQGGPATPVTPNAAPAVTPDPASTTNSPPVSPPAPAPTAPTGGDPARPGILPITDPKVVKPTEAQRNRKSSVTQSFDAIGTELDRYTELVKKTGVAVMPGEAKDNLNTVRQGIMLQLKELFNLGVLNGPDLSLMEKMIFDPVVDPLKEGGLSNIPGQIYSGATGDTAARAENSVKELKRMLENIKRSVDNSTGQPVAGQQSGERSDLKTKYGLK